MRLYYSIMILVATSVFLVGCAPSTPKNSSGAQGGIFLGAPAAIASELSERTKRPIITKPQKLTQADFAREYGAIQIVTLPPQIVATVTNQGPLGQRNDDAFEYLAGFILGDNDSEEKIAMTSPVTRSLISTTEYETAFIMPEGWNWENLPEPNNERVSLKELPSSLNAVRRFSGYTSQQIVDQQREQFQKELESYEIVWYGQPTLAQYDGPRVPASRRTNELRVSLNPSRE